MKSTSPFPNPGVPFQAPKRQDPGQNMTFGCMGCGVPKPGAGSRGVGIRRRCFECLQKVVGGAA